MAQGFLAYTRNESTVIGGIGDFHADLPPRAVPADVAHQYDTPEARDAGWVVTWTGTSEEEEKEAESVEPRGEPQVEVEEES